MNKITFRKAKINDLPRIVHITKLAYKHPYHPNTFITKAHEPKDLAERFSQGEFQVLTAILDKKIIACVRYNFDSENNLNLNKLVVLKTFRNKGIGNQLLRRLETIAQNNHSQKILLDCAQEKKLDQYYANRGFEIEKILPHHDHHDVYMYKNIF